MKFSDIGKLTESISKVRLRGGVVGKVSTVLITVAISMAAISWSVGNVWIAGGALAAIFIMTLTGIIMMISFAKKNPQAALFEGAELLIHERMKMGMKDMPELPTYDEIPTLPSQNSGDIIDTIEAKKPDELPNHSGKDSSKSLENTDD